MVSVHDVPDRYLADGSVLVTSGTVNPTSTIVSLALRNTEFTQRQWAAARDTTPTYPL